MQENVIWAPQPGPQHRFVTCPVDEIVYGGARGGGKTDAALGEFAVHESEWGSAAQGLIIRRSAVALQPTIQRAQEIYGPLGGEWKEQKGWFVFPSGARLKCAYLDRDADAENFQGHAYTRVYVEELTQFINPAPLDKLKATLRSSAGAPCQFRATCNPGGPGHNWVKARYIDPGPWKVSWHEYFNPFTKKTVSLSRVFIPAKLSDNPMLLGNDPLYVARLSDSGSAAQVKAWLEGDWDIVDGAFFDGWSSARNVVKPFKVPDLWTRFISFDWGYAAPFSVGWWAVASDPHDCGRGVVVPRGALVRYREWYGSTGKPNEGLRLEAEAVALGIKERTGADQIAYRVADPSIFREDGGPSIGERMARAGGARWRPADNTRIGAVGAFSGWDQMRARIKGDDTGPMLVVFDTCRDFIRTVPVLQHDPNRAEDLDCWVAGTLISTPGGNVPIERVGVGDYVNTPIGPRPVLGSYLSGSGETVEISLSDGRVLRGTPRHRIVVKGSGLQRLDQLQVNDILQGVVTWSRALNIAVECIAAMRAAITTSRAVVASAFIVKPGSTIWGRYLPVTISTTSTTTATTTPWKTSSALRRAIMSETTCESVSPVTLDKRSRHGVARNLDWQPFGPMRKRCGPTRPNANYRADIVAVLSSLHGLTTSFARKVAPASAALKSIWSAKRAASPSRPSATQRGKSGPVRIVAVGRCAGNVPVYNLTVADAHLFYANGILSSNTKAEDHVADECRYACLSRPMTARNPVKPNNPRDLGYGERITRPSGDWKTL